MEGEASSTSASGCSEWPLFLSSLITGLSSQAVREQKQLGKAMTRLLPLVTRGQGSLIDQLLNHFAPYTDFDAYDERNHADDNHTFMLECWVAVLAGVRPGSALAERVKRKVLDHGLVQVAAAYLVRQLPAVLDAGSQQWSAALARPALPFVLQMLGSLAKGHVGIQTVLLASDLMSRLHALERQSSSASKAIGTLAESLLEALRERAAADVDRLRQETIESKRKAALDKRQRMLKAMGMGTQGKTIVAQTVAPSMIHELAEETGHVCVVCGEGETYRPGEALGCYTFCKRVPLVGGGGGNLSPGRASAGASSSEMGYTSVSHFNLIHFSCHRDATRAERTLKQPKEEWEGATLRNSQTKCNNLLPIQSSTITDEAYAICVEQWWASISTCGRVDAPRVRLLVHDLRLLLLRLALEESFSADSCGGGRESNLKMLPYLVQMATFLLDARASPQRRLYQRTLATYVSACTAEAATGVSASAASAAATTSVQVGVAASGAAERGADSPFYMLTLSLLTHSLAEWEAARLPMLRRACVYWRGAGQSRERYPLLGPASPSASPSIRPCRSPAGIAPSRSPLDPSPAPLDAAAASAPGTGGSAASASGAAAASFDGRGGGAAATPTFSPLPEKPSGGANGGAAFGDARPVLLFFSVVELLQRILKPSTSSSSAASTMPLPADDDDAMAGGAAASPAPAGWVAAMKSKLQSNEQTLLKSMSEMLSTYEDELLQAGDANEVFDILGMMGSVMDAGGNASTLLGVPST